MQVKEITLYEENQRLDEVAPWILGLAAWLFQGAVAGGVTYIGMKGLEMMLLYWQKAGFNPIAEAIPDKMRIKVKLKPGDPGYGKSSGVKPKWYQYNASSRSWHEARPRRGSGGTLWKLVKGGRAVPAAEASTYLQRALHAQSQRSRLSKFFSPGAGYLNMKGVSKEAWQAAYLISQVGMQNAGGKYAVGDEIPGKKGVIGDDGKDGTKRTAKLGDPDVRDARAKYPESLRRYEDYIKQSKRAAAWAAASKYIAKVGPWLMAFAPLGTAVGMVYTGRFTAQAYHLEYLDWVEWSKKDKATRGEKVGITLEEYTERMIAYRASIVLTFIGLSSGLGILGAMMIMNSIAMKGLGWTKEKVMDKGELDDKLKKDFKKLGKAVGRNIPPTRIAIWLASAALIPLSMTKPGQRWFAYILTEFTFWGFFEGTYWDKPNSGVRTTIAKFGDKSLTHVVENWMSLSAWEIFGNNAILNPADQTLYQNTVVKGDKIQQKIEKTPGKEVPADQLWNHINNL